MEQGFLWGGLGLLGLAVGSFLNVVIHRLPIMIAGRDGGAADGRYDLAWPPSACPGCGRPVRPVENLPLVSFILLGGRCRGCRGAISLRYPLVELSGAVAPLLLAMRFADPAAMAGAALFAWIGLAILVIDLETQLIPDALTRPLLWSGLLVAAAAHPFVRADEAVVGAACGYALFWLLGWAAERGFGRPALGRGDVKLLAALGAWVGWSGLPHVVLLASASGALVGIALLAFGRLSRGQAMPFGPFLVGGGFVTLGWGQALPF